ncbi:MAG: division/cell wall cluster transcriptional repressor MraZ [Bacilli bacterium]|nr:division/cell wall cluster transcriptional repressor MraZ [Bacilli bacterium]
MFMGEYHHSIDDKGRIIIPSKLREGLKDNCIITRGLDGCLFIYPQDEWNNVINKYKELPDTKEKRQFMRIFLSGASICEYDKQGRINVPKPLIDYANLEKDCIIIGVDERLELWSKDKWNSFIDSNEEAMSTIADKLFCNS